MRNRTHQHLFVLDPEKVKKLFFFSFLREYTLIGFSETFSGAFSLDYQQFKMLLFLESLELPIRDYQLFQILLDWSAEIHTSKKEIYPPQLMSPHLLGSIIYIFASRRIKRNILKKCCVHGKKLVPIIYW